MTKQEATSLIEKYLAGQCSEEEKCLIQEAYMSLAKNETTEISSGEIAAIQKFTWESINANTPSKPYGIISKMPIRYLSIAAIALICLAFSLYFYNRKVADNIQENHIIIQPNFNKALLTLSTGESINLDSSKSGIRMDTAHIIYNDGSTIKNVSIGKSNGGNSAPYLFKLSTPNGAQYQATLSDGTKVWLNAASSLTYPATFSGMTRTVRVTGEVYFKIANNQTKPFIVLSKDQEIHVLGTEFNISVFDELNMITTTLVSGSLQVIKTLEKRDDGVEMNSKNNILLKPGEQSILSKDGSFIKHRTNIESVIAWRYGQFRFYDETLESVMNQISRWYNVAVEYQDESLKKETYSAITKRFDKISILLGMLEKTGKAKFDIKNNKIIISKK
ncbi:FecR family protein [bacterium A37T11]|nr:FecR family protein [bacterium A37T11]